ncbi:MAG TPA: YtxH domain-containing protein [Amoebophilaceae bacterium]|jgi:gas vesicle protein|nr:YtxH domain-containing protein [Amoebophilaceae bacterium]
MSRNNNNVYYLLVGVVLGAVLGILVCDETKKRLQKQIKDKTKLWTGGCETASEAMENNVKNGVNKVKGTVKEYFD